VRCFVVGADKRTLIPIIYRPCVIPDILRYIAMLDYTREDAKPWFWQRLASSLRTATPQSAILHPFPGASGYPVPRPVSYSAPGATLEPGAPTPVSGLADSAAGTSTSTEEVHMEMTPVVSSQFVRVQSSQTDPRTNSISARRRSSSTRHQSSPSHSSKLPSIWKFKKKQ